MEDVTSALSALSQAIGVELDGRRFYTQCAERTQDPMGKSMFQSLIKDEEQHIRILQNEYDRLAGGGTWLDLGQAREGTPVGPSLKLFPNGAPATLPPATNDLLALSIAMDFERKGYSNYKAAAGQATDPIARQIFDYLASFEEVHYEYLEKHRKYLDDTGTWAFFEMERPIYDI
ncbi:MAG: ferritin family protein [Bacteroidetes bacterium]|nr:ferritin family protein [Bacteroidota bacterium]MCL5027265.1 ferritin family protein [Chloroflexota bacterium]